MAFEGFEDFILTDDSLGLFEELYTHHIGEDIDRLNFAMGKVETYLKEHKTFGQAKDLLDLLVRKASEIHEETILCEDNYAFVWTYLSTILTAKGCALGLQRVEAKMRQTVKERTMPVSYLLALGQDAANTIQKALDEADLKDQEAKRLEMEKEEQERRLERERREEEKRLEKEREREETHPTDPEKRRKLFASKFLKP